MTNKKQFPTPPSNFTSKIIDKTQGQVSSFLNRLVDEKKGRTSFFRSDTGTGKTTGYIKAVQERIRQGCQKRVLIAVPTMKDADAVYRSLTADPMFVSKVMVYTSSHRDGTYEPKVKPKGAWLSKYQVVVGCQAWLLDAKTDPSFCVGDRDLVVIDEVPDQSQVVSLSVSDFQLAREYAETNIFDCYQAFVDMENWATSIRDQVPTDSYDLPDFPDPFSVLRVRNQQGLVIDQDSPLSEVLRFAQGMVENRSFVRCRKVPVKNRQANKPHFVTYEKWTPFFPNARFAVFSATVHLDGYQFHRNAKALTSVQGSIAHYPDQVIMDVQWVMPSVITSEIVGNKKLRDMSVKHIMSLIAHTEDGAHVLVVVPKMLKSDVKDAVIKTYGALSDPTVIKKVFLTHYGCDVGSNAYAQCSEVILWSNQHKPEHAVVGELFHFADEQVCKHNLSDAEARDGRVSSFKEDKLYAVIKQMGARGSCRFIDDDGNALPMRLWICWKPLNVGRLEALFPGHTLERHVDKEYESPKNSSVLGRVLDFLAVQPKTSAPITLNAIADQLGMDKANLRKKTDDILQTQERFVAYGWRFVRGAPKSRTNMHRFERV